jgi:hypothetical protein
MIVNIRGTSGSGKTTIVRRIMELCGPPAPLGGTERRPYGYLLAGPGADLYVVGSYENVCGGCDGIKTQDEVCERVRGASAQGDVLFEGLLISHLFSRYASLARELSPTPFIFAFLDTPLEVCLQRVQDRRLQRKPDSPPLNPTNTIQKWHDCRRAYQKFRDAGLDARWVNSYDGAEQIMGWLREGR